MNTPKIRFKGFTDDWEQRKLESLCDVFMDGDWIEAKDQSNAGIRLVQTGNVGTTKYLNKENNQKWISEETFERLHCKEIYSGDILISRLPEPAGRACIVPELGTRMITAVDCTIVRTAKEYDSKYLVQYLSTTMYFKIVNSFLGGGTRQRISRGNLSGIDIPVPGSLDEQKKIGEYFSKLDHLITLHQRKCDETKQLKKFMLQKMFPKNGEKNPEIRFEGFTDDWEQRKFKELCDMVTVGIANSATHAYSDSGVVMFRNQNIKPNFLDDTDIIHINSEFEVKYKNKRLKKNDLLVARTGYPGTACVVPEKYENSQTFTTLIARPNENVNPYFLCQYLNSDIGIKYFESTQIGGGQKNSGAGILNEMPVTLPSTIEEEKQIADYFIQLDNLITLHQRKCEKLKELKKFMLQNMFV